MADELNPLSKESNLIPVKLIGSTYSKYTSIQERLLNSYLELIFYKGEGPAVGAVRRFVPFLGDVVVSESRKANYIDYTPISRNSSIPFYTGSESRMFKITYEISPNFLYQNPGFVDYIKEFRSPVGSTSIGENPKQSFFPDKQDTQTPKFNFGREHGTTKLTLKGVIPTDIDDENLVYSFIDYQINLIRSSVINNAEDPTKGPPIVRLNHGLLYQDIPCICKDYSIDQIYDESNKKNFHTKFKVSKNKVQISINLQEVRLGNFLQTKFDPTSTIARDNIVGWEWIVSENHKSLDPISPIYR